MNRFKEKHPRGDTQKVSLLIALFIYLSVGAQSISSIGSENDTAQLKDGGTGTTGAASATLPDSRIAEMLDSGRTDRVEALRYLKSNHRPEMVRKAVVDLPKAESHEERRLILELLRDGPGPLEEYIPDWYVYLDHFINRGKEDDLLKLAASVAAKRKEHRLIPSLKELITHPMMGVRFAAFEAMSSMKSDYLIPSLLRLSESEDPVERIYALEGIARYHDHRLKKALIAALEDEERAVRIYAIKTMHGHPDAREFDGYVARAMSKEKDPEVRRIIVRLLGESPWRGPTYVLHNAIAEDPDPLVRILAIKSAVALNDHRSTRYISHRLTEEVDPSVKREGVKALMILDGRGGEEGLAHIIENEPDSEIRLQAVIASGYLKEYGVIRSLVSAISSDPSSAVRMESAFALGRLEKSYATPYLQQVLTKEHESYEVRSAALTAILAIENTEGLLAVRKMSNDSQKVALRKHIEYLIEGSSGR